MWAGLRPAGLDAAIPMSVSVIIPVYNAAPFLATACASVLSQPEVSELLLVEDGSQDASLAVCQEIQAGQPDVVRVLQHAGGVNRGAGASRNLGIAHVRNEFVAFLDADDRYQDGRFTNDLRVFAEHDDCDGVYNAINAFFEEQRFQERFEARGIGENALTTFSRAVPPDELFESMEPVGQGVGRFSGICLTVRRRIFSRAGLFNEELEISQDTHMWVKMSLAARLYPGVLDRPLASRRIHAGNRCTDDEKLMLLRESLFLDLLRWSERNQVPYRRRALLCARYCQGVLRNLKTRGGARERIYLGVLRYPSVALLWLRLVYHLLRVRMPLLGHHGQ